jgi:hypothetical protein
MDGGGKIEGEQRDGERPVAAGGHTGWIIALPLPLQYLVHPGLFRIQSQAVSFVVQRFSPAAAKARAKALDYEPTTKKPYLSIIPNVLLKPSEI